MDQPAYRNPSLPVEERVADLLGRMTVEEKAAQLYRGGVHDAVRNGRFDPEVAREAIPHGIASIGRPGLDRDAEATARFVNDVQRFLVEETRLGIPALVIDEALHGQMSYGSTSFPQAIALASTWDVDLVQRAFTAAGAEMRARGSNLALTPVLDLARDPRWGRTEETYGEDPYLVSRMGVAAVRGLQAGGHVMATAKHYAVHGQPEAGTNSGPGNYAERVIREEFLLPFQAAVTEAGVGAVMASYNEVNGIPLHINRWLLQQVLREEWGFQGMITSDGGGVRELVTLHHVAADEAEAARKALAAGIELELGNSYRTVARQVQEGLIPMEQLDRAVARILRAKFLLGLFEDPYARPEEAARITNGPEHRRLALEAARKAIVLLKNEDGLLPLDLSALQRIAVIGPNAADLHLGGYSVDSVYGVSVLEGIRRRAGEGVEVLYAEGCRITTGPQGWQAWWVDPVEQPDPAEDTARIAEAARLAAAADVAVLAVGGNEGTCREGWSANHLGDRDSLDLLGRQDELIRAVLDTGTPTVVLLINGRPLTINEVAERVPAILEGWYLGQGTGTAVAEVLFGDVNPAGRLPITFPRSVGQIPAYYYHKPSARRGYLFTSKEPLFPFGHGLSYTTFRYDNLRVTPERIRPDEAATVRVEVTNTGPRAGDEVVQLYIHDQVSSLTRPVKALKGFRRITLQPGEMLTVELTLTPAALAYLDEAMRWTVEPGLFDVMVGPSSARLSSVTLEVTAP